MQKLNYITALHQTIHFTAVNRPHRTTYLSTLDQGASHSTTQRFHSSSPSHTVDAPRVRRRKIRYLMSTAGSEDDLRNRTQQSPLASQRAKAEHPSEANRTGRFATMFPLGYKDTFSQWWANISPATAEHNVLSFIPYLNTPPTQTRTGNKISEPKQSVATQPNSSEDLTKSPSQSAESHNDPFGPRTWHSNLVKLSGKNRALNEFSVERIGEHVDNNLVIVHGYGAGLGFFYKNFEALSRAPGWKLYALDLLGMGRSTRPPFKIQAKDRQASIKEAEDWFIDSLEEWRKVKKLDRFTLIGHSLGGYMAVAYALKYPGHLDKLILASPVGIPEDPYAVTAAMPEPEDSTIAAEFTQTQDETTSDPSPTAGDNNNFMNSRTKAEKASKDAPGQPPRRPLSKWITYLWDANISPFSLVRWSGPFGPRFVSGWTSRRFSHLPPDEAQALHTYAYTLFKQRGSGEYALAYILAPGAFARSPLIRRIGGVGRQYITPSGSTSSNVADAERKRETGVPVVLMYGENDWMDVAGGYAALEKLKEEREKALKVASEEEKERERGEAKVLIVKKAGHHVYLDGWEEFNEMVRGEMDDVGRKEKARKEKGR